MDSFYTLTNDDRVIRTPKKRLRSVSARVGKMLHDIVTHGMQLKGFGRLVTEDLYGWMYMVVADRACVAQIQPVDLDNADGPDALAALYIAIPEDDFIVEHTCVITPQWRRVTLAASRQTAKRLQAERVAAEADARAWSRNRAGPQIPRSPRRCPK